MSHPLYLMKPMTNTDPPTHNQAEHSADNQADDATRERLLQHLSAKIEPITRRLRQDWPIETNVWDEDAFANSPMFKTELDDGFYEWGWARAFPGRTDGYLVLAHFGGDGERVPSLMHAGGLMLSKQPGYAEGTYGDPEFYFSVEAAYSANGNERAPSLPVAQALAIDLTEQWLMEIYQHS